MKVEVILPVLLMNMKNKNIHYYEFKWKEG
jgi:hypothetical protein